MMFGIKGGIAPILPVIPNHHKSQDALAILVFLMALKSWPDFPAIVAPSFAVKLCKQDRGCQSPKRNSNLSAIENNRDGMGVP